MGQARENDPGVFPDTHYLHDIDLQTLAEDAILFTRERQRRVPHMFIRPDDRTAPSCPVYLRASEQGVSYLGLISEYGSHEHRRPPVFSGRIKIRVVSRTVKAIADISDEEFGRAYTSVSDAASAIRYLEGKYPGRSFSRSTLVTVYTIAYL